MDPVIITLRGEYDLSRQSELRGTLEPFYHDTYVVLDLTGVSYVDSTCICEFIRLRQTRAAAGLRPACFVVNDRRFGRLFHFLGLDEIFTVVHSLEEAFETEFSLARATSA